MFRIPLGHFSSFTRAAKKEQETKRHKRRGGGKGGDGGGGGGMAGARGAAPACLGVALSPEPDPTFITSPKFCGS